MSWNDDLDTNSVAYSIASDNSVSMRVVAGPGTGKSFALKRRVAKLLEDGVPPNDILPVTFTRVSAEDLHRELRGMDAPGANNLKAKTVHSLALSILLKNRVSSITGRIARLLSQKEEDILLSDLVAMGVENKSNLQNMLKNKLSAWASLQDDDPGTPRTQVEQNFENAVKQWLCFHKAMLIGEVVPELHKFLVNNPTAPEFDKYKYVLIDEYQDLNKAEQSILDMLAQNAQISIVGDDDQSIYSFKNAHPEGIRQFTETHPSTQEHELLECRRCPIKVVEMANSLIANNNNRDVRKLTPCPTNGDGECHIWQFPSANLEINHVANTIKNLIDNKNVEPGDILVLAQGRFIGNPMFEKLKMLGIPTISYYQENQIDKATAQEALAYLRLLTNHYDPVSLRSLLVDKQQGYRSAQYVRLLKYCSDNNLNTWDALEQLSAEQNKNHKILINLFNGIKARLSSLEACCDNITVLINSLFPSENPDMSGLIEIVNKTMEANPDTNLQGLREAIESEVFTPEIPEKVDKVRVMSFHKSKGLSSNVVFLVGCMDGLIPRYNHSDNPALEQKSLEEQRRLFYVGLTRVKADPQKGAPGMLYISSANRILASEAMGNNIRHRQNGADAYVSASPYIAELGLSAPKPVNPLV